MTNPSRRANLKTAVGRVENAPSSLGLKCQAQKTKRSKKSQKRSQRSSLAKIPKTKPEVDHAEKQRVMSVTKHKPTKKTRPKVLKRVKLLTKTTPRQLQRAKKNKPGEWLQWKP